MKELAGIAKALGDSNRLRALLALQDGELCLCQIIELLGLAQSTVSKHMSILRQAGLVVCRKQERWMYYRLPDKKTRNAMVEGVLRWVFESLKSDDSASADAKNLKRILARNPSSLCRMQRER